MVRLRDLLTEGNERGYDSFAKESKGEIYTANSDTEKTITGEVTDRLWDDGAPVTKHFKKGTCKIPKGEFQIIETKSYWYWRIGRTWNAVSRKKHSTPPFNY